MVFFMYYYVPYHEVMHWEDAVCRVNTEAIRRPQLYVFHWCVCKSPTTRQRSLRKTDISEIPPRIQLLLVDLKIRNDSICII